MTLRSWLVDRFLRAEVEQRMRLEIPLSSPFGTTPATTSTNACTVGATNSHARVDSSWCFRATPPTA
ncbi:MAG: hypothetical protein ACYCZF_03785 [Anaerolineae bacterium]